MTKKVKTGKVTPSGKPIVKTVQKNKSYIGKDGLICAPKLNLACGQNKVEGFFGIDKVKTSITDAVVDLNIYPWPIVSDSAEEVIAIHFIEHIPINTLQEYMIKAFKESKDFSTFRDLMLEYDENVPSDGMIAFMEELCRIMKKGAKAKFIGPYWSSIRCWQDPTHRRALNEASLLYFNKNWREANKLDHYGIQSDFDYDYGYHVIQTFNVKHQEAKDFAVRHYVNSVADIEFVLTKR